MTTEEKKSLIHQIDVALDSIRPHLEVDGGNIEVVDLTPDMVLEVRWVGTCETCSMSAMTLKAGIEETIRANVPAIKMVRPMNGLSAS